MIQDVEDFESNQAEVINISSEKVSFILDSLRYVLKPKEIVKINKAYTVNRQLQPGRDAIPSVIELETNFKVLPVVHPKAKSIYKSVVG